MAGKKWITFLSFTLSLLACRESKYLGAHEQLYASNKVEVKSSVKISRGRSKAIREELEGLLRPRLNGKFLGFRFKLWVYNIAGTPKKKKGFRNWLKTKVGEPPVLASPTLIEKNRDVLQNYLENKGYFHDTVMAETLDKKKLLTAIYTAQIGPQYLIRNVSYPMDTDALNRQIDTLKKRSLLKKNDPYDLDVIKDERIRIDSRLKQRGYYYFNPNNLIVDVDSSIGGHRVDLQVRVKQSTPPIARLPYYINEVTVYAQYDIHMDTSAQKIKITDEGYRIIDSTGMFLPVIYKRTLVFHPGDLYKRNDHNLSLSRLTSLGVFKFVKARFEPVDTLSSNKLNVFYYLTPAQKKSIRFEASGLTRSDNTTGGELSLSWRNRNFFKGAELFSASIYGGLEEQFVGGGQKVSTTRAGVALNLVIPRIVSPLHWFSGSASVPKTKISAGYDIFNRSSQYTLTSIKTSYGFIFKNNLTTEHQLTVLGINYVRPTNINPAFQLALDTNITLRRSIERQFIIGSSYNFNYNSLGKQNRRTNNFYFNGNIDLSGNILGLITGANIDKGKEKKIFNTPFSQYARFEADFRHYLSFGKYSMFASRITGGAGFSYGNSSTMPFIKEFFVGGSNDIRAFRSRALGPGSYFPGGQKKNVYLPDQPGDVKMEMNAEYRNKLFSIVRWALFVDAGNIWTLKTDSSRPGSTLSSNFLKDIAVGVGTGLRFDLSILVLRIDVAVPVRYPWLPEGQKWQFNKAADISKMVLNLAIGYPF
ncbi:translocation and assembly module lipoprotein TamL [Flavitalea flava]